MTIRILTNINMAEEDHRLLDDVERDAAVKIAQEAANYSLPVKVEFIDSDGNVEEWDPA